MKFSVSWSLVLLAAGAPAQLHWNALDFATPVANPEGVGDDARCTALASDGIDLWYWSGSRGRLFRSFSGLPEQWREMPSNYDPLLGLPGWNPGEQGGMAMAVISAYGGWPAVLIGSWRDDNYTTQHPWERQRLVGYDGQSGRWRVVDTPEPFRANMGFAMQSGYLFAHQFGAGSQNHMHKVALQLSSWSWASNEVTQRGFSGVLGADPDWFGRVTVQALHTDGLIYTVKNDRTEGLSSGDRLLRYDGYNFSRQLPAIPAEDLGMLPFQVGEGCALVSLPPNFNNLPLPRGGLFLLRGAGGPGPNPQEGRGQATNDYAIFDVATRTWTTGTLPGYSGSGGSAAFHRDRLYVKRGHSQQNNEGPNTDLWVTTRDPDECRLYFDLSWTAGVQPGGYLGFGVGLRDAESRAFLGGANGLSGYERHEAWFSYQRFQRPLRLYLGMLKCLTYEPDLIITRPGDYLVRADFVLGDVAGGDNYIDVSDFLTLAAEYELGYPYDTADLNYDMIVDIHDFLILASNYGLRGSP